MTDVIFLHEGVIRKRHGKMTFYTRYPFLLFLNIIYFSFSSCNLVIERIKCTLKDSFSITTEFCKFQVDPLDPGPLEIDSKVVPTPNLPN